MSNKEKIIAVSVVSFLFILFPTLFCIIYGCVYKNNENMNRDELEQDFSKWIDNGFCCYYEKGNGTIHLPDGHEISFYKSFSDNRPDELVCVSKNQLILSFHRFKPDGNDIEMYNWDLTNRKHLWSIEDDDYCSKDLQDGTVDFWHSENGDYRIGYNADFQNGIVKTISPDDESCRRNEKTYFEFVDDDNEYTILKKNAGLVINNNKLDSEVLTLFNKWNFVPSISRVFNNGTIWMAFNRDLSWGVGQKAVMLVSYDYNVGEVNGYQFSFVDSSNYVNHLMFPILDEFKEDLVFFNN